MELQTGMKIKIPRSDNRGEYKSDPFMQLCRDEGIERRFKVRETATEWGDRKILPYFVREDTVLVV